MKFVFIFVALLCANLHFCQAGNTSGNQKVCASPCAPININVHGNHGIKGDKGERGDNGSKGDKGKPCKCSLQDTSKPSAHIEAVNKRAVTYHKNTVIKDWSVSALHSHLAGGMTYKDGKLTVPISGRYYIYAQIYYHGTGRVIIRVNNNAITIIQPIYPGTGQGTLYAGGVFNLKAGDNITLHTSHLTTKLYMWAEHSYFGSFLV